MKKIIVTLGDSWAAGMELLEPKKQSYGALLVDRLGYDECVMLGQPSSSIYHTVMQLVNFETTSTEYADSEKLIIIDLTQTGRYLHFDPKTNTFPRYGEMHYLDEFYPHLKPYVKVFLEINDSDLYNDFHVGQTMTWIQNYCETRGYRYLFIKHLQDLELDLFAPLINWDHVYNEGKDINRDFISEMYPNVEYEFDWRIIKYGKKTVDPSTISRFFTGTDWHPNALGHELIADRLETLYNNCYS